MQQVRRRCSVLGIAARGAILVCHFWFTKTLFIGLLSAATMGAGNSAYLYQEITTVQRTGTKDIMAMREKHPMMTWNYQQNGLLRYSDVPYEDIQK